MDTELAKVLWKGSCAVCPGGNHRVSKKVQSAALSDTVLKKHWPEHKLVCSRGANWFVRFPYRDKLSATLFAEVAKKRMISEKTNPERRSALIVKVTNERLFTDEANYHEDCEMQLITRD